MSKLCLQSGRVSISNFYLFLIQFLKVILHLQLLQNTGCIPCVVYYIPVALSYSQLIVPPTAQPLVRCPATGNHCLVLCVCESASFFVVIFTNLLLVLDSMYK